MKLLPKKFLSVERSSQAELRVLIGISNFYHTILFLKRGRSPERGFSSYPNKSSFMRIAIISDPHLGYSRFEEDSYIQAERALTDASGKADIILCAGDIFDIKIPKLETLKRAIDIFNKSKIPIIVIYGNHERRTKDSINPVQLLAASTEIVLLHGGEYIFEKDGETLQVFGMGSVPEEYAETALNAMMKDRFVPRENAFKVLMIHQTIRELVSGTTDDELSLDELEDLPFDLIIDGHIHETISRLDGRFLIPGSTVITQLKEPETAPKGYYLYDTKTRKAEFIGIKTRRFFYEKMEFTDADEKTLRSAIEAKVKELRLAHPDSLIAIKIAGTIKKGLANSDIELGSFDNVFIDNNLGSESLASRIEKIKELRKDALSVREIAQRELSKKTSGLVTLFDSSELFEKLVIGADEAETYLEGRNKKEIEKS